jgi:hypothetical protein
MSPLGGSGLAVIPPMNMAVVAAHRYDVEKQISVAVCRMQCGREQDIIDITNQRRNKVPVCLQQRRSFSVCQTRHGRGDES